jgi:hypothetical protein
MRLMRSVVPAHLLSVYFVGDKRPRAISCPRTKESWKPVLADEAPWLSPEHEHRISNRIHKLFLPMSRQN